MEVGLEHEIACSCLLCKYQSNNALYLCNFFSMVHALMVTRMLYIVMFDI